MIGEYTDPSGESDKNDKEPWSKDTVEAALQVPISEDEWKDIAANLNFDRLKKYQLPKIAAEIAEELVRQRLLNQYKVSKPIPDQIYRNGYITELTVKGTLEVFIAKNGEKGQNVLEVDGIFIIDEETVLIVEVKSGTERNSKGAWQNAFSDEDKQRIVRNINIILPNVKNFEWLLVIEKNEALLKAKPRLRMLNKRNIKLAGLPVTKAELDAQAEIVERVAKGSK